MKIKIKYFGDDAKDFYDKEIPEVGSNYTCWAVILIDFVLKEKDEKYNLQVFLNEYKSSKEEKMMIQYITDDLEIFLMIMLKNRLKLNSLSDLF